jgi:hypothetical protein
MEFDYDVIGGAFSGAATALMINAMAGLASVTPRDLSTHFTVQASTFVPTPATTWPISSGEILLAKM